MPTYDSICDANGVRLEVKHKMDHCVETWSDLCRLTEVPPGDTPLRAPVEKRLVAVALVSRTALSDSQPACARSGCRPGGSCGL